CPRNRSPASRWNCRATATSPAQPRRGWTWPLVGGLWRSLVVPGHLPYGPFVKRIEQRNQGRSDEVEEKPPEDQSHRSRQDPPQPAHHRPRARGLGCQLAQAGRADHAVIVLRDALPAEELQ